jgi:hypothetical protein
MFTRIPLLIALAAALPAQADIVKCMDRDGNVTLTDLSCPPGSVQTQVVSRTPPAPMIAPRLDDPPADGRGIATVTLSATDLARQSRRTAARLPVPRRALIPPTRLFSTDAATLKAARMALILGASPEKVAGR